MVGYKVEHGVAVLEVAQPPLNGLSRAVRSALMDAIDRAEEDDSAQAIVLIGAGQSFPSGADVMEYDAEPSEPQLRDLCERVEFSEKPVVAALAGTVFDGGLELALSCHYRVAQRGTRFGFPQIHLGLPPSAGGSQRLPRLVGAALALDMLMEGRVLSADNAAGQRMVDTLTDGDVRGAALAFCARLLQKGGGRRPLSAVMPGADNPMKFQKEIAARRARWAGDEDSAEAQILSLVEASALLPFQAGLDMESEIFAECLRSQRSRGLRHAFQAERRAARFDLPRTVAPKTKVLAVLGAGPLAVQIVVTALNAGFSLRWGARDPDILKISRDQLTAIFDAAVAGGGISAEQSEKRLGALTTGSSEEMAQGADMAILAARGQKEVPLSEGAVRLLAYPSRVKALGLRFVPPVYATRLVEVLQGPQAQAADVARATVLAGQLGKVPVLVKSSHDTLAGRLGAAMHRAADALIDQGASPYEIDTALRNWGLPTGPFQARDKRSLGDMAHIQPAHGRNWSAMLQEQDRMGAAEGGGFYDWSKGKPSPSRQVQALLDRERPAQSFAPEKLVHLVIGAMANEGLRLLTEGKAQRASDLDVVSMLGLEVPRHRGGIMKAVSFWGLFTVQKEMERLGHPDRDFWTPQPEWARLVKNGQSFDDL